MQIARMENSPAQTYIMVDSLFQNLLNIFLLVFYELFFYEKLIFNTGQFRWHILRMSDPLNTCQCTFKGKEKAENIKNANR